MKLTKEDYLNSLKSWVKYSPWEWVSNYCDEQGRCWFDYNLSTGYHWELI